MKKPASSVPAVFAFESAHPVRVIEIGGEPWFVAVDVCGVLGLQNPSKAASALDCDERSNFKLGRQGDVIIINESGLYTLVMRCRDAVKVGSVPHKFRKWVTAEVLPSIRKHGFYAPVPYTDSHAGGEKLTALDMANLRRCVWRISSSAAGGDEAWTRAVWAALRATVGRRDLLLVEHLPSIADVLRRAARLADAASAVAMHVGTAAMKALAEGDLEAQVKVPALNVAKEAAKLDWWTEREVDRLLTRSEPIMDHPEAGESV